MKCHSFAVETITISFVNTSRQCGPLLSLSFSDVYGAEHDR